MRGLVMLRQNARNWRTMLKSYSLSDSTLYDSVADEFFSTLEDLPSQVLKARRLEVATNDIDLELFNLLRHHSERQFQNFTSDDIVSINVNGYNICHLIILGYFPHITISDLRKKFPSVIRILLCSRSTNAHQLLPVELAAINAASHKVCGTHNRSPSDTTPRPLCVFVECLATHYSLKIQKLLDYPTIIRLALESGTECIINYLVYTLPTIVKHFDFAQIVFENNMHTYACVNTVSVRILISAFTALKNDSLYEKFDGDGQLIVHVAALLGNISALHAIFKSRPEMIMKISANGFSVFHCAIVSGNAICLAVVFLMLVRAFSLDMHAPAKLAQMLRKQRSGESENIARMRAFINMPAGPNKLTPLILAAFTDRVKVIDQVLYYTTFESLFQRSGPLPGHSDGLMGIDIVLTLSDSHGYQLALLGKLLSFKEIRHLRKVVLGLTCSCNRCLERVDADGPAKKTSAVAAAELSKRRIPLVSNCVVPDILSAALAAKNYQERQLKTANGPEDSNKICEQTDHELKVLAQKDERPVLLPDVIGMGCPMAFKQQIICYISNPVVYFEDSIVRWGSFSFFLLGTLVAIALFIYALFIKINAIVCAIGFALNILSFLFFIFLSLIRKNEPVQHYTLSQLLQKRSDVGLCTICMCDTDYRSTHPAKHCMKCGMCTRGHLFHSEMLGKCVSTRTLFLYHMMTACVILCYTFNACFLCVYGILYDNGYLRNSCPLFSIIVTIIVIIIGRKWIDHSSLG